MRLIVFIEGTENPVKKISVEWFISEIFENMSGAM